jgi:glycosyltransferase involved in cell wall biosynthesis
MRVSLCVICGNESACIERLLSSFETAFDELSLVRAIGNRKPDDTVEKAKAWCGINGKAFLFSEYRNIYTASNWDHIDDFAAARNKAFEQATGDWLVWADCDDVYEHHNADLKATLASKPDEIVMVRCIYDVRGTGKALYRERAIRRETFHAGRKWHHAVHENLLILPGDKHEDIARPVWVHAPLEIKRENRHRNLRILSHQVRDAATQIYYVHQEHYCNQNKAGAIKFGELAVSFDTLPASFRYEAHLNLARLAAKPSEAMDHCLKAHAIFPWCREALGSMILVEFERNDATRARWWAEQMLALREPLAGDRPWTHEQKWYEWLGYDLAARAFRLDRNKARADVLQAQFYAGKRPVISLLHATRGRSSKAVGARQLWYDRAADPTRIEHIFAVDADDKTSLDMARQFIHVVSTRKSCVAAWNQAARACSGDILVQVSDDWVPPANWDSGILEIAEGRDPIKEEFVIAPSDGSRKDDLLCMAILSRARYEKQGHLFFDGYESVFSDNEFTHRAHKDGIVIDAREKLRFEHLHPAFGKAPMDATYAHNNTPERYKAGEALFKERNP